VHDFSIAAGIAGETDSRLAIGAAYGLASLVGVERVYTVQHWTSDVVASAMLATTVASATDRALRARMGCSAQPKRCPSGDRRDGGHQEQR
jgi:membrane-associated phospholipid phosphatase